MFRSVRPAVLIVLAVAVACTDQPTEPTSEAEGSFFLAAPPPPPAPPTVLTGELGGGTGLGVSTELGFWESPVYATVTVDGALGYSGRPDGYLPGTGQIDAAGILVQNQCDLTVFVSFATSAGGATLPIAPTCWYPARNMGSYSRRMTLQGRVWTYRTAGPPLSCYKGITPCVSYTGTQSVTVTPEEGHLILTPNKTVVAPGGGIYVTAKAVWAGDEKTAVPFTVREWRWDGKGPEVGGGHTNVCAVYNPNQCIVSVYQSGNVVLEALVNGKVKTASVGIEVIGGDTLPFPPPPDSLPPNDSLPPTDTIPGGGGCDAGCCGEHLPAGIRTAECEPPKPTAILSCNGESSSLQVVRGSAVECSAKLSDGSRISSVRWLAMIGGGPDIAPGSQEAGVMPDGLSSVWSGPVALSTRVQAGVTPLGAAEELPVAEVEIVVTERSWPQLRLPQVPPIVHRYTFDGLGKMTLIPQQGRNFLLGAFGLASLKFRDLPTTNAETGPNRGVVYYAVPITVPTPQIWTHPGLRSGPWYDDQNGGVEPGTHLARCESTVMATLEPRVEDHEGVTRMDHSHWGTADGLFEFSRLTPEWEAMVQIDGRASDLHRAAQSRYDAFYQRVEYAQDGLDDEDYPVILGYGGLGCKLDMDPSNGDR